MTRKEFELFRIILEIIEEQEIDYFEVLNFQDKEGHEKIEIVFKPKEKKAT